MAQLGSQSHAGGSGPQTATRRGVVPFGKYLLLERISVGGMAEVYKAKAFGVEGFEKILAIKRILPTIAEDEEFIDMFIDEAKIVGQLSHANICQVLELGRIGDSHFIAMEYIWGRDLLQIQNFFRRSKQTMPVPMAVYIMSKVCEGLDYAHRKRDPAGNPLHIVHRDVSPQNVLVAYEGAVKIIDFGIARAAYRQTRTQAGVLKGKFGYMSPEQVRGLPIDHRSDLFAVGTLLYELLTGERLFLGESDFSTLDKVRNADVAPPTRLNRTIPPDLEQIVMKSLAREPGDRWQWASELQEALQRCLINFKPVFTTQKLAAWMKGTFAEQISRDKVKMEEYARIGREALVQARRAVPPPVPVRAKGVGPAVPAPQQIPLPTPAPMPAIERPRFGRAPLDLGDLAQQARVKAERTPAPPPPNAPVEAVSLDAMEQEWLASLADGSNDDDLPGEATVVGDLDMFAPAPDLPAASAPLVPRMPGMDDEGDEEEGEEPTQIFFTNEEALANLVEPSVVDLEFPPPAPDAADIPEQPTRMLDTRPPDAHDDIPEQPTRMLDTRPPDAHDDIPEQATRMLDTKPLDDPSSLAVQSTVVFDQAPHVEDVRAPGQVEARAPVMVNGPAGAPFSPQDPRTGQLGYGSHPAGQGGGGPVGPTTTPPGAFDPFGLPAPGDTPWGAPPPPMAEVAAAPRTGPRVADPTEQLKRVEGDSQRRSRSALTYLVLFLLGLLGVVGGGVAVWLLVLAPGTAPPDGLAKSGPVDGAVPEPGQPIPSEPGAGRQLPAGGDSPPTATLVLSVEPGDATIEVGGAPATRDPETGAIALDPGQLHSVRVSAPRHRSEELTLTLEPGQQERREVALVPTGEIEVTATTQAAVLLDGSPAGTTPTTLRDLDLGEHRVRLTAEGYEPAEKTVRLTKVEPVQRLSVRLDKTQVATREPAQARTPRPAPSATKAPDTRAPAPGAATSGWGSLVVSTQPWGRVLIDGRDTGRNTPILPNNPLKLRPGSYRLTVRTNAGESFSFPVSVVEGQTSRIVRRLE